MTRPGAAIVRLVAPLGAVVLISGVLTVNASGSSPRSPSAPLDVRARVVGSIATINWTRPERVGVAPLVNYVVSSRPAGLRCVSRVTHCRIRVHQPDVLYQFVVTARNRLAIGPPSLSSNSVRWNVPETSTTNTTTTTVPTTSSTTTTTSPTTTRPSSSTTVPGSTPSSNTQIVHDTSGDALQVQFEGFLDPASSATIYFAPYNGYRYVAVELSMTNLASAPLINDPTSNTTVTGSDGKTYVGIYDDISNCANLAYTNYTMAPRSDLTGCVVFELPLSVQATSIHYSLSFDAVDEATWVPSPTS